MSIHNSVVADVKADLYATIAGDGSVATLYGDTVRGDMIPVDYLYDANSSAADSFPDIIKPTLQTGNGRWVKTLYQQFRANWSEASSSSMEYVQNKPSIPSSFAPVVSTIAAGARNFNQAYQVDTDQYAEIRVSASISCALTITAGQSGEVFLEYSADGSTGWTLAGKLAGSNTGTVVIGVATTQISGGEVSCMLQPGYRWRLRTNNVTGTPTYSFNGGTETVY